MAGDPNAALNESIMFDRGPLVNAWHIIGEKILTIYDGFKYRQDVGYALRQSDSPFEAVPDITFQHPMHPESHKRAVGIVATVGMFGLFCFGVVKIVESDMLNPNPTPTMDQFIHRQYNQNYSDD